MNHARNDYLHGNELSGDRLTIKASGRNLFSFAPPLYRLLLTGYLGIDVYGPPAPRKADEVRRILNFRFESRQNDYELAISRIQKPSNTFENLH